MYKKLFLVLIFIFIFSVPSVSQASVLSDLNAQIQNLLQQIASLQQQVKLIQETTPTITTPVTSVVCPTLSRNLWYGTRGSDVASLQQFLRSVGTYTYPIITGYYGSATVQAVQNWQARTGIVNYGSPYTTGFGIVGPRTRVAIANACGGITPAAGSAPVIKWLTGPTTLNANQTGTWIIKASDPQNGSLSYSIDWGDSVGRVAYASNSANSNSSFIQSTTLTHSYRYAGTYTVSVVVRDNQNLTAKVTTTVHVIGTTTTNTFSATPTSGNAPLSVRFSWTQNAIGTSCPTIDFGDGTQGSSIDGCPLSMNHTYSSPGTYYTKLYKITSGGNKTIIGTAAVTVIARNNPLTVTAPSGQTYIFGNDIPVTWSTNINRNNVGMYLVLQNKNGSAIKSQKVRITAGKAIIKTNDFCNNFFSDAIDSNCSGLKNLITKKGSSGFTVKAVIYTPKDACFGYCPPNLRGKVTNVASSVSKPFSIIVNNGTTGTLSATPTYGTSPLLVKFTWEKPAGLTYFGGFKIDYGDGSSRNDTVACPDCSSWLEHTYINSGTYTARIIGIGEGTSNVLSTTTIVVNSTTTNTFSATPTSGNAPLSVRFSWTKKAIGYNGACPTIEFGDGVAGSSVDSCPLTTTYSYTTPGTYIVKLYSSLPVNILSRIVVNRLIVGTTTIVVR